MVRGLEKFREYFEVYPTQYVLIGGTAATLANHKRTLNGLSFIGAECLIPLKACAYLDLYTRKETGAAIDSGDIKKHKNDIFRLYTILNPQDRCKLANLITKDLQAAFQLIRQDATIDPKALGIRGKNVEDVLKELETIYGLR